MPDNIFEDLKARMGGAPVGVCGEDAEGAVAAIAPFAGGLLVRPLSPECGAVVCIGGRPDIGELAAGRPCAVVCPQDCSEEYGCAWLPQEEWSEESAVRLFRALAGEFPVRIIGVDIPGWMRFLPEDNSAVSELVSKLSAAVQGVQRMKDVQKLAAFAGGCSFWQPEVQVYSDFVTGEVRLTCAAREGIFFAMLSEIAGEQIDGEYTLMKYISSASEAMRGYAKVRDALDCARVNGYGIVGPDDGDMTYEQPQTVRQGNSVGIKLRASAPAYHVIRVDVSGEVCPIMGDASQSEGLVKNMMDGFAGDPEQMWNTDVFGKSLRDMVRDGLVSKVSSIQEETRSKLRKAVTRMVNEGKGGVICIIL